MEPVVEFDPTLDISALPDSVVDWVVLSLRSDSTSGTEILGSRQPGLVQVDGSVVDTAGSKLLLKGVPCGGYYLVVGHRNHLAVMSSDTLDTSDGEGSWDFTSGESQAFGTGALKEVDSGRWALFAADGSVDGQVTASDFNLWLINTKAGATGYQMSDFDLDGQVTASDFNLWLVNTKAGAATRVP